MTTNPRILTMDEVAALTRIPKGTLRWYRNGGQQGPRSFRLGGKRVCYYQHEVLAWIEAQANDPDTARCGVAA